jgi:hypothetical protein
MDIYTSGFAIGGFAIVNLYNNVTPQKDKMKSDLTKAITDMEGVHHVPTVGLHFYPFIIGGSNN